MYTTPDQLFKDMITTGEYPVGGYMCNSLTLNKVLPDVDVNLGLTAIREYMTHLGNLAIRLGDEGHLGVRSAQEMIGYDNYDVHTMRSMMATLLTAKENNNEPYFKLLTKTSLSFMVRDVVYNNWDNRPMTIEDICFAFDKYSHMS